MLKFLILLNQVLGFAIAVMLVAAFAAPGLFGWLGILLGFGVPLVGGWIITFILVAAIYGVTKESKSLPPLIQLYKTQTVTALLLTVVLAGVLYLLGGSIPKAQ